MHMSEMPAKLATALAKAQAEIKPVPKNGFNPHFKKSYSTLTDVWDTVREPLTKNGVSIVQMTSVVDGWIVLNTIVLHTSGESMHGELPVAPVGTPPQQLGSALSYVRRYALLSTSGASADDDDDANAAQATAVQAGAGMGMAKPAMVATAPTQPVTTLSSPPPPVERRPTDTTKLPPKSAGSWTLPYKSAVDFGKAFKEKVTKAPDIKAYEKLFTDNDPNIMRLLDENPNLHDEVMSITNQRKEALLKEAA